jgi:hypothetical protein
MIAEERFFEHFMDPVDGVLCLPEDIAEKILHQNAVRLLGL